MATGAAILGALGTVGTVATAVSGVLQAFSLVTQLSQDSPSLDTSFAPISTPAIEIDEPELDLQIELETEELQQAEEQRDEMRRRSLLQQQAFGQGGVLASANQTGVSAVG